MSFHRHFGATGLSYVGTSRTVRAFTAISHRFLVPWHRFGQISRGVSADLPEEWATPGATAAGMVPGSRRPDVFPERRCRSVDRQLICNRAFLPSYFNFKRSRRDEARMRSCRTCEMNVIRNGGAQMAKAKYRQDLPQRHGGAFLTDTLIFHEGIDLPYLAGFVLLKSESGRERLTRYYRSYLAIAQRHRVGFVLSSPTWRASPDWAEKLSYDTAALDAINKESIAFLENLRDAWEAGSGSSQLPCVINGTIGPRGDGYKAGHMNAEEAQAYHGEQIASFVDSAADMVTAFTLTNISEAIGIVRAAKSRKMPCAISFTVETDGRLVNGETLQQAIETVDRGGEPDGAAEYFAVNCAHPTHFEQALDAKASWTKRIYGIRADASTRVTLNSTGPKRWTPAISRISAVMLQQLEGGVSVDADYQEVAAVPIIVTLK